MEMAQESRQPSCNIFLIGFMGAGKSTIAAELKRQLDLELVEMDQGNFFQIRGKSFSASGNGNAGRTAGKSKHSHFLRRRHCSTAGKPGAYEKERKGGPSDGISRDRL